MYRLKMIVLIAVSLFFLMVGVGVLVSSYQLNDPFSFVLAFFASNLMILISASLCLGFAIRLKRGARPQTSESAELPPK